MSTPKFNRNLVVSQLLGLDVVIKKVYYNTIHAEGGPFGDY